MRRSSVAAVAVALFLVGSLPVFAQDDEPVNPLDVLIDAFQDPEGQELVLQITNTPTNVTIDPRGDFEHSTGEDPGYTPDHIDILGTSVIKLETGSLELFGPTSASGFWAPRGPMQVDTANFGAIHTFTGEQVEHDGTQYEEAIVFVFALAETPPIEVPGQCEYVVWVNDLSRGPTFVNHPALPGDPAGGTNIAFGLRLHPQGQDVSSTFTLELNEDLDFVSKPEFDIRAFVTPDTVVITVPWSHAGEIAGVNFYTFCMEEGFTFEPAMTGSDQTGLIEMTSNEFGQTTIALVARAATTTPPITESSTTDPSPNTAASEQSTDTTNDDSSPLLFVAIGGGTGLGLLGWWVFTKRERPCRELLQAVRAAQRASKKAARRVKRTAGECARAEAKLDDLERQRKDICTAWPPVCWKTKDGSSMEDVKGNRVTSRDVHLRKMALGEAWDDYKAGKLTALEVEGMWRELDTPEFREEMREREKAFEVQLAEIDKRISVARNTLDDLCDQAEEAEVKASDGVASAESAKTVYEDCVQSESV